MSSYVISRRDHVPLVSLTKFAYHFIAERKLTRENCCRRCKPNCLSRSLFFLSHNEPFYATKLVVVTYHLLAKAIVWKKKRERVYFLRSVFCTINWEFLRVFCTSILLFFFIVTIFYYERTCNFSNPPYHTPILVQLI